MNFSAGVLPSAHSQEGICSSATAFSLKGLWAKNSNLNFMWTWGMAWSSAHSLQRMTPSEWGLGGSQSFWLATPKASFLSLVSRHTNCCRVQPRQKCSQVLLRSAKQHKRGDVTAADIAGWAWLNGKIVRLSFSPLVDCVLVSSAKLGQCGCVHRYCNPF